MVLVSVAVVLLVGAAVVVVVLVVLVVLAVLVVLVGVKVVVVVLPSVSLRGGWLVTNGVGGAVVSFDTEVGLGVGLCAGTCVVFP